MMPLRLTFSGSFLAPSTAVPEHFVMRRTLVHHDKIQQNKELDRGSDSITSQRARTRLTRFLSAMACMLGIFLVLSPPARADLRLCNTTSGRVGVALGFLDGAIWVTEGWFNLKPGRCETIIRGRLGSRYFYLHAIDYDRGGDWSGPNILCVRDTEFSIRGPLDCYARGYERAGFIEIDTGQQPDWTVELGNGGLVSGRQP